MWNGQSNLWQNTNGQIINSHELREWLLRRRFAAFIFGFQSRNVRKVRRHSSLIDSLLWLAVGLIVRAFDGHSSSGFVRRRRWTLMRWSWRWWSWFRQRRVALLLSNLDYLLPTTTTMMTRNNDDGHFSLNDLASTSSSSSTTMFAKWYCRNKVMNL